MSFRDIRLEVLKAKSIEDKQERAKVITEVRTILLNRYNELLWEYLNAYQELHSKKMSKEALLNHIIARSEKWLKKEIFKMKKKL
jgi:hypothetical protein